MSYIGVAPSNAPLTADDITNGIISADKLATNSVTTVKISDANITSGKLASGVSNPIIVADEWRLTSAFTFNNGVQPITANLERVDTAPQGQIGTAMSVSSGVFTFPSTGYYLINYIVAYASSTQAYIGGIIQGTTNNGTDNYPSLARGFDRIQAGSVTLGGYVVYETIVDVSDTSNVKVRFAIESNGTSPSAQASSSENQTSMRFTRLGDT